MAIFLQSAIYVFILIRHLLSSFFGARVFLIYFFVSFVLLICSNVLVELLG